MLPSVGGFAISSDSYFFGSGGERGGDGEVGGRERDGFKLFSLLILITHHQQAK